ncbi:penicillin-binding protein 1C [Aquimarina hainanensis]|uniref:penicillin-binding protein 1C n=1 Tax=Aquimarina hainanensis TaxID=1578017 RepID=UPI00361B9188
MLKVIRHTLLGIIKKRPLLTSVIGGVFLWFYFCLPATLFKEPTSTVVVGKDGGLLGAKIAEDGQWRFPETDSVPYKFEQSLLMFEDQQFYYHPGFNPVAIFQAIKRNAKEGRIVRGGSTLTQQLIRLSRKGKKRTYTEKIIELIQATRLELKESKKNILRLYASHAPFGGNVVGIDMASWRYFGLPAYQLSWAESATLAVLPNAPSLIYPGKNQIRLKNKRDLVLKRLLEKEIIDSITYTLSVAETLPQKPFPLPRHAPHLIDFLEKTHKGELLRTTIDEVLQKQVNVVVKQHYEVLKQNDVHNMAVLVMDVNTRKVRSYIGNTPTTKTHQKDVDIVQAARSTGSTLKPLLYALMMDKGELLPKQLISDVPTIISGYQPKNFDEKFSGVVSADRALARSLNVPAVRLLQQYGLQRFRDEMNVFDIEGISFSADHYGLSLILGGAEASLWDLCKTYAGFSGILTNYTESSSEYYESEFVTPILLTEQKIDFGSLKKEKEFLGAGSIWATFEAMKEVNRPQEGEAWKFYDSSREIAWKTGTSFGNRDAWAIGVTRNNVVGVWVGNADGEGRPELTGLNAAAPVLFDVFNLLPDAKWFEKPYDDLKEIEICKKSGYVAGSNCPRVLNHIPVTGIWSSPCAYHTLVHLDAEKKYRVNSSCEPISDIVHESWFVLSPLQEFYYKQKNATYRSLPPFRTDCQKEGKQMMDFIFPKPNSSVFLPKDFTGKTSEVVLQIAHNHPGLKVFWYVDDRYIGTTEQFHEKAIQPSIGEHTITVVDELGNTLKRVIEIRE